MSLDDIEKVLNNKNHNSFIDFCEGLQSDERLRDNTRNQLQSFINILKRFGKIETFSQITFDAIQEFDYFLYKQEYNVNTIRKKHALLRRYINKAIDAGNITDNPYSRFKLPRPVEVRRKFLSREHLHAIIEKEMPNQRLDTVKDKCPDIPLLCGGGAHYLFKSPVILPFIEIIIHR